MKFSKFYFSPQEYVTDNNKMRIRLGSYIHSLSYRSKIGNYSLAEKVKQGVGIIIPGYTSVSNNYVYNFEQLLATAEIIDLLDILSVVYTVLNEGSEKSALINFVNECFIEEGLAYEMNFHGEVRFRPDQEFERNRIFTLRSLTGGDLNAAIDAFNSAFNEFQTDIKKSKSALRYIFEANEIVFKKLVKPQHDCSRLTSKNIDLVQNHILNDIMCHLDETAKNASTKLLESYKKWVDAMHPYRHGQDVEAYDNPPVDLAILALSNGASYLRWLASMLQIKIEKKSQ